MKQVIVFDLGGTLMEYAGMPHAWISYYENCKIYDDTIPVITTLRENGLKVAALTNLPSSMPDRLFKADIPQILEILDLYVSSETCGYRKPNQAGLACIAEHFKVRSGDLFFVGDEKLDIDTAKNAGCTSVLLCRNGVPKDYLQDYTIKSLFELKNILPQCSMY